jgi:hypothetical protein
LFVDYNLSQSYSLKTMPYGISFNLYQFNCQRNWKK